MDSSSPYANLSKRCIGSSSLRKLCLRQTEYWTQRRSEQAAACQGSLPSAYYLPFERIKTKQNSCVYHERVLRAAVNKLDAIKLKALMTLFSTFCCRFSRLHRLHQMIPTDRMTSRGRKTKLGSPSHQRPTKRATGRETAAGSSPYKNIARADKRRSSCG